LTLGEHLVKRRILLVLYAMDAAKLIGVSPTVYRFWEQDRVKPVVQCMTVVIKFLDYDPYPKPQTLGEQIRTKRRDIGLTQEALGTLLGISHETIIRWERGEPNPRRRVKRPFEAFLKSAPSARR